MGELVIIGQQIEFKNRIRITSRTVPVTPPALVVFDVVSSKKEFVQGSTTTLTVTGRGLQDLSAVASANSGVTVAIKSVDAKGVSAEIEVKVLSTAPTGPFSINFSSMEGPNPFLLSGWMVKPATAVISSTLLTTTTEVVPGNPAGNYVEFTAAENSYIANLDNATGKSCGEGCTYSLDKSKTPIKLTVVGAENAKPGERSVDLLQNNVKVATLKFQFKAATPEAKLRSGIELKCSTTPQELELIFEGKNLKWAQLINEPL
ncbi:MAG: hypothetical protein NTZ94_16830, partial [Verrucomicrobia bacterium]|nr:hypothetical protein [Verrucomicrobiota bacterium]